MYVYISFSFFTPSFLLFWPRKPQLSSTVWPLAGSPEMLLRIQRYTCASSYRPKAQPALWPNAAPTDTLHLRSLTGGTHLSSLPSRRTEPDSSSKSNCTPIACRAASPAWPARQ